MAAVTIHLDTAAFAKPLARVEASKEIVLAWEDTPIARLIPGAAHKPERKPGRVKGKISLDDSFFEPLPEGS